MFALYVIIASLTFRFEASNTCSTASAGYMLYWEKEANESYPGIRKGKSQERYVS